MHLLKSTSIALLVAAMYGCGGGGGSAGTSGSTTTSAIGTVAVGAPLAGATITFIDTNGKTLTATTGDDGKYSVPDLSTLTAPILIKAVGVVGGQETTLFSTIDTDPTAGTSTVANITPLTNAIVSQVSSGEPEIVFNTPTEIRKKITSNNISTTSAKLVKLIEDSLSSLGVSNLDPFKTAFTADSTGVDKLLDLVKVEPDPFGKMQVADKTTGKTTVIASTDSIDVVASKKLSNVPTSVQNLEFPKIKNLIDSLNTAFAKGSALTVSDISPLLAAGFLHKGEDATAFALNVVNEPPPKGYKVSTYVINSCVPSTKVCNGVATLLDTEGKPSEEFDMPVKWVNGQWYFYGNQLNLDLQLQPVIDILLPTDVTTIEAAGSSAVEFGFWFNQTRIDDQIGRSNYDSIKIYFSNDEGANFYPAWTLVSKVGCNYFPEINDANTGGCNNFLKKNYVPSSSRTDFSNAKASFLDGKLRVKVDVLKDVTVVKSAIFTPRFKAYDQEDVMQIARKTVKSINFDELGSTAITLLPRVHFINMDLISSSNNSVINNIRVDGSDKLKAGSKITVAQICDLTTDSGCSTPHKEKIWSFFQNLRPENDPSAMIWINYSKTPQ